MSETLQEQEGTEAPAVDVLWANSSALVNHLNTVLAAADGQGTAGTAAVRESANWLAAELFLQNCGKPPVEVALPRRSMGTVSVGRQLFLDEAGRLCWYPSSRNPPNGPMPEGNQSNVLNVIAQFIGDRYGEGFMLLNGDGFERWEATGWQDNVRERSRAIFGDERTLIVPYEAISGARIDVQTIKPIHITPDTDDVLFHDLGDPPGWNPMFERNLPTGGAAMTQEWMDALWDANPQQVRTQPGQPGDRPAAMPARGSRQGTMEFDHNRLRWRLQFERSSSRWHGYWYVWQPLLDGEGQWGWQRVRFGGPERPFCHWREDRHRLGASVFWANGFDGRKHRFISAFDQHEPDPLYYLAQLPDKGKVETYEDAIRLLAPPIVHEARRLGRHVERQGDVFAIETNVKTREIYKRAKQRVRRSVVLQASHSLTYDPTRLPNNDQHIEWAEPKKGEVSEYVLCPGCGNHRFKVGFGPKARRALTIFRTSHTATEVVVCEGGVTFIRGMMHHDPQIEEPGRAREHVNRPLQEGKWYLAVRNTVPQQGTTRSRTRQPSADAQNQALADQDAQVVAA